MPESAKHIRKKLIEVSIPLEEINKASAREKSIRHGHPSTLHLWWARRPLAACRAVLFAQLVDDPSAWPERFPSEEEQDAERRRLHKIIERMVPWEASNDEAILNEARWEIARSVAWGLCEEPPAKGDGAAILDYLQTKAPPVYDPFSGGGSIPLEAQRLGLRAYGSDLNPVAVLIGKALVEIPPKFAGLPPVNPEAQAKLAQGGEWSGKGAQGLAEDVRYYGKWMRDEAEKRIGHLYPKAKLPDGSEATVIAWLWARTVRSPDPAAKGAMVPLVSSFMLSIKEGKKAWVEPIIDPDAPDGWRFEVRTGTLTKEDEERLKKGTKTGHGANFQCVLTSAPLDGSHIKAEASVGRMSSRMLAIVAEGKGERIYLPPSKLHEETAQVRPPVGYPENALPLDARAFTPILYGLDEFHKLFSARQLFALTTFSDLVNAAREHVFTHACRQGGRRHDEHSLSNGGVGANAYADAVATYLAFATDRLIDRSSTICTWDIGASGKSSTGSPGRSAAIRGTFARQALQMTWDFAEANVLSESAANFIDAIKWVAKPFEFGNIPAYGKAGIFHIDATKNSFPQREIVVSTDPPYYDNIGYADLSDYFYGWMRRSIGNIWPELFRRLATPKEGELVASQHRHVSKSAADDYFMNGMSRALYALQAAARNTEPLTIYYAFKQSELEAEGLTSAGWSSFLQAVVKAGLSVDGTWPIRTELPNRMRSVGSNALASSVVLVCRKRPASALTTTRAEFIRALKKEMPDAIDAIRKAGVGPVDMQQSVIGPGMGVFTRYAKVLESDDSEMSVKTALSLINRVWEEIENELDANFDPETQVALAWFSTYGFDTKPSGELTTLANAKNIPDKSLFDSGVFANLHGKVALVKREQLPEDWSPKNDRTLTIWECVQHVARVLKAQDGGGPAAARLVRDMGAKAADAQKLAYRLYEIASQKGWSQEALVYNELAQEWAHLEDLAADARGAEDHGPAQAALQF